MAWILYEYKNCDSCRKARKFLQAHEVAFESRPIRETPPSIPELRGMLACLGDLKRLFNTAGGSYREGDYKTKLPKMTENEALDALHADGNLIKRPFFFENAKKVGTTGFKEEVWRGLIGVDG